MFLYLQHLYMLGGRNGNVALRDFWRYSIGKICLRSAKFQVVSFQPKTVGRRFAVVGIPLAACKITPWLLSGLFYTFFSAGCWEEEFCLFLWSKVGINVQGHPVRIWRGAELLQWSGNSPLVLSLAGENIFLSLALKNIFFITCR